jgi:hypothetical protein
MKTVWKDIKLSNSGTKNISSKENMEKKQIMFMLIELKEQKWPLELIRLIQKHKVDEFCFW